MTGASARGATARLVRAVFEYLRPHAGPFALAIATIVILSAAELLKPWPLKIIVDSVLGSAPLPVPWLATLDRDALLVACCLSLVALHAVVAGLSYWSNRTTIGIGQRMVQEVRSRTYAHLQRLSLRYHSAQRVGDLVYRLTNDALSIQTLAMNGIFPLLSAAVFLVGMTVILARIDLFLTVLALAIVPFLFVGIQRLSTAVRRHSDAARREESDVLSIAHDGLAAIRVVQAFTREPEEHRRFVERSRTSLAAKRRMYLTQTLYGGLVSLLIATGTAVVLFAGARRVIDGSVSVGEVLVFLAYLASLYQPIHQLSHTLGLVSDSAAGVGRVLELLEEPETLRSGVRRVRRDDVAGEIRFESVRFSYDGHRDVLQDVSLVIPAGRRTAFVGPSGAGKTTLASLVPRFYDPVAGRVLLDGVDLRELELRSLRESISMVLQPPIVFPVTLAENIAYGRPGATAAEVERAARAALLGPLLERLPLGLDAPIGEQGVTLSEGERLRLTIARALLRDAPIVVLDEPTASLDALTESLLLDGLRELLRNRTTVIIAHRLTTIRSADHIVVVRDGKIVEQGVYDGLAVSGGFFAELVQRQASSSRAPRTPPARVF